MLLVHFVCQFCDEDDKQEWQSLNKKEQTEKAQFQTKH